MDLDLQRTLDGIEARLRDHIQPRNTQEEICRHSSTSSGIPDMEKCLRDYLDQRWQLAETRILRAFVACQQADNSRLRKIEAAVAELGASTTQQLEALQSKVLDLETRIINLEGPQSTGAR
jgi:hypothetical protein